MSVNNDRLLEGLKKIYGKHTNRPVTAQDLIAILEDKLHEKPKFENPKPHSKND